MRSPRLEETDALRQREMALFGGPAGDRSGVGSGCFSVRVDMETVDLLQVGPDLFQGCRSLPQLLGRAVEPGRRTALPSGLSIELTCLFSSRATETDREDVLQALGALATFGGVGLLARRAMGSLNQFDDNADLEKTRLIVARVTSAGAPRAFPTFSESARVWAWVFPQAKTGLEVLDDFASALPHRIGAAPSRSTWLADQTNPKHRRPSPLHLHVQRLSRGYALVATFLPTTNCAEPLADYLKQLARTKIKGVAPVTLLSPP